MLPSHGKDAETFSNALVTMFSYVTDDPGAIDRAVRQKLGPAVGRTPDELAGKLLMGTAEACAERIRAYQAAGVQRIVIWPAADEIAQLRIFAEQVMPLVAT
jgi:alkanesulfonate monooxygenase SsuD/methylene tetrahydromethanopterin reductase-like flavin-dependent oxidoreductase (luciferase family)